MTGAAWTKPAVPGSSLRGESHPPAGVDRLVRQGCSAHRHALGCLHQRTVRALGGGARTGGRRGLCRCRLGVLPDRQLVAAKPAGVSVTGEQRTPTAEASQTVRRVAQEAVTNVRKHARGPGSSYGWSICRMRSPRRSRTRVDADPDRLAVSGSGYGLLGMRERAELLGGTLEAGPGEEGFVVTLRVPA